MSDENKNDLSASLCEPASSQWQLEKANEIITKLTQELKNMEGEKLKACEKMMFFRTMLCKLLDL